MTSRDEADRIAQFYYGKPASPDQVRSWTGLDFDEAQLQAARTPEALGFALATTAGGIGRTVAFPTPDQTMQQIDQATGASRPVDASSGRDGRRRAHIGGAVLVEWRGVLVAEAVAAILGLAEKMIGRTINLTDGYRTAQQQTVLKQKKPNLAADPGRSFHERGLAIDVNYNGWSQQQKNQFTAFMKAHGFTWGGDFKRVKEPWHFGLGE